METKEAEMEILELREMEQRYKEADMQILEMFSKRPAREEQVVLVHEGRTMFVPTEELVNWERKQREEATRAAVKIGVSAVLAVMTACVLSRVGNPVGCLAVIGGTLMACGLSGLLGRKR